MRDILRLFSPLFLVIARELSYELILIKPLLFVNIKQFTKNNTQTNQVSG
jgi:hypothetical protein